MKKILVKYPSRERPVQFYSNLMATYLSALNKDDIEFVVSLDIDDPTIDHMVINDLQKLYPFEFVYGKSENKIHACNRDLEGKDFDILLLLSDDMVCQRLHWDVVVRDAFSNNLDKVVHFNDGYTGQKLMTLALIGKPYYDRFGYIYNPEYKSLWCDNEMMEVAKKLDKYEYRDEVLFRHVHYSNVKGIQIDSLMKRNEAFYHIDKQTFERRRANNFFLNGL